MKDCIKQSLSFWSWNDKLEQKKLIKQIERMRDCGFGGFFMHARSGLKTEYLSKEWFDCVRTCIKKAKELKIKPWLYDENGWPSGAAGGRLLSDEKCLENFLTFDIGALNENAFVSYDLSGDALKRLKRGEKADIALNVYKNVSISTVDILDDKVTEKFISHTHEVYDKEFGGRIADFVEGFFTDEPQYYGGATPFPHLISDYFRAEHGEDVLDGLGLLFFEKSGYEAFRYKYYLACQTLFLDNYSKKIYEWCENHGVKLTGHYVEEANLSKQMYHCAGVMPFYEYEHIPAIDWLCRRFISVVPIKQLVSAAAQTGKKEVMTESFAMTGWDVTPTELKAIAEFQFIYGVNYTCMHLFPYSEVGDRKNDYPAHFSDTNAWAYDVLPRFNEYFDKLGEIIRNTEEDARVGVIHPMRTAYIKFRRRISENYDESFTEFSDYLAEKTAFHYLDETLLEKHGFVSGDKLVCGKREYSYVILPPEILTVGKNTDRLLREFVKNGGKILVAGKVPSLLEGKKADFGYLKSNVSIDEIVKNNTCSVYFVGGKIRYSVRRGKDFIFISVLNIDAINAADCEIVYDGVLKKRDILSGEEFACDKKFTLKPYESAFFVADGKKGKIIVKPEATEKLSGEFEAVSSSDNYLVLDKASFSFDGKNFGEERFVPAILQHLLNKRFDGEVYLKFGFDCRFVPQDLRLAYENCQPAELFVNGNKVVFDGVLSLDDKIITGNIAKFTRLGQNEIIEKVRFYQNEKVYYALFGKNVTEFLKNSLVYDTYIDCLRLAGSFGVFEKDGLKAGNMPNVFLGENFYIDKPVKTVADLVKDGYLFFAGRIRLKKTINLSDPNVNLKITGRVHYAKLWVNGRYAGEYLFNDSIDVSDCAVKGENEIILEIVTGSRNLFGPFHDATEEESYYVKPSSFTFCGQWNDFDCAAYTERYSFVRTGLFDCDGQFRLDIKVDV